MNYITLGVKCQEVPNELTLILAITGCPRKCPECHSPEQQNPDHGYPWHDNKVSQIHATYQDLITCVCIFGGELYQDKVLAIFQEIKNTTPYKTCWYLGQDLDQVPTPMFQEMEECLDFAKFGAYDKVKGGLASPETNQEFLDMQ